MIRPKLLLAALAFAALAACTQKAGTDAKSDSVATVDGQPISRNTYEEYVKGVASKPASDLTADQRNTLLENLVRAQVIAADAEKTGVAASNDTRAALDISRLQLLQQASSQAYLKDRKPSDEELHAEYDIQVSQLDKTQYHAAHILVPTEDAAKQIIAQLKAGADFAKIAKAQSTDSGSRDKGGDLDWVAVSSVVAPFGDALKSMKKGRNQRSAGEEPVRLPRDPPARHA